MHVMVATDGSLDPETTAGLVANLAGEDGQVTVFTAVEIPRQLLRDMRTAAADANEDLAQAFTVEYRAERADTPPVSRWVGDDAVVESYVSRKVADRTNGLAAALAARNVDHTVFGEEAESPARAVLTAVDEHSVDVLCVGTHGLGRFEGLLGSISTKLARNASCSVLLVR